MYTKRKDYEDETSYINKNLGKPKSEGKLETMISQKALRNLPHSSYSIQADPYAASLPGSQPYPILASFNKKVGGCYKGLKNIDGGNVQQYANSNLSTMLKYADFIYTKLPVNYRMLPINMKASNPNDEENYTGKNLIDEQRKSIAEATSVLSSTTFTQMAINNYAIVTDMPMGSAETENITIDGVQTPAYTNLTDVLYASLTYYQIVLQAGLNIFNWHNSMRLKMGTMIRRSWNRETPTLNALFGLFKKKSFLSFMDSMALSFEGEYIDTDEMKQLNMLTLTPSARSNALTDPLLELAIKMNRPNTFKLVYVVEGVGKVVFDQSDLTVKVKVSATETQMKNYFDLIDEVVDMMSAEKIMDWARDPNTQASSDTGYYNEVKWRIDGINHGLTRFKTLINDIREVLDTMSRTGTNTWTKGFRPTIVKDTDAEIYDNLIVNDIYKIMASSADTVDFDEATKRWRTFSLWNMYDGIPEYDAYQGGAFLTLSLKNLDYTTDSDNVHGYLPIRFTNTDGYTKVGETQNLKDYRQFFMSCRDGQEINVDGLSTITMAADTTLSRLAPLASQMNLTIRVPKITTTDLSVGHRSCAYKTLTQIFGLCQVPLVNNQDISLDPDIIAIYQIELEDITNEAITYARAHAPFRGTMSTIDILGFGNYDINNKRVSE